MNSSNGGQQVFSLAISMGPGGQVKGFIDTLSKLHRALLFFTCIFGFAQTIINSSYLIYESYPFTGGLLAVHGLLDRLVLCVLVHSISLL